MKILSIVDISPYIHSGIRYKPNVLAGPTQLDNGKYKQPKIKAGGVAFLFQALRPLLHSDAVAICVDTNPTIKKAMYPNYKLDRNHDSGVKEQCFIAKRLLEDCGFEVFERDGYESDDAVYSIWKKYQSDYDQIDLFVADSDMHFMVNEKTRVMPVNSKSKMVTMENYQTAAISKKTVVYNASTLDKVVWGDAGDGILQPVPNKISSIFMKLIAQDSSIVYGHDKSICQMLIRRYAPEDKVDILLNQLEVVFPLYMDLVLLGDKPNEKRFGEWCRALDVYGFGRPGTTAHTENFVLSLLTEMEEE